MPSVNSIHSWMFAVLLAMATGCNDKTNQPVTRKGPHVEVPEEGTNIQAYLSEAGMQMGQLEARVKGKLRSPYMLHFQRTDSPYFEFPKTLHVDFFKDSIFANENRSSKASLMPDMGSICQTRTRSFCVIRSW
jgi:hypothetical protein